MRSAVCATLLALSLTAGGCTAEEEPGGAPSPTATPTGSTPSATPIEPATTRSPRPRPVRPADFEARQAMDVVRHLAGTIGPRHGTSPEFREAAGWVDGYFRRLDYRVQRQRFDVPGGISWGVPVAAGTSQNVVATPPGFRWRDPHVVVGAHLDTVPQAPGAEDNASGVGVLLAAAASVTERRTRLPVVWVAFGAEEPRGPGDDDHHYGSRAYVGGMTPAGRRSMRAMVSLDRVGVGARVPVGSAEQSDPVQRSLLAAARRTGIDATAVPFSRSSDHWSFVRARLPAARLGSTPYAAYHSADDVPDVVRPYRMDPDFAPRPVRGAAAAQILAAVRAHSRGRFRSP